jgi:nucleotide-binding universal stress UspA family protein
MNPKTIVVPLDGSEFAERALPVADKLAERIGGGLMLVSAQYYGPIEPRQYLDEQAALRRSPVEVIATKDTYAAEIITETVEGSDDRVVCMTTHGRGRLRWAALGSVAENVIRRTTHPMFLVGRNCRPNFLDRSSHLLACVDGREGAAQLAPEVNAWSELLGLSRYAAVVMHPLDVASAEHQHQLLDPIAAEFGGSTRVDIAMLRSRYVAGALADFADELPAAVIAMNSHARGGLARFALGSVTMGVLHLAPCPLLVMHRVPDIEPDGEG